MRIRLASLDNVFHLFYRIHVESFNAFLAVHKSFVPSRFQFQFRRKFNCSRKSLRLSIPALVLTLLSALTPLVAGSLH